ncbi:platelet glycoprotein 4-like protein, partial [Leptotrombidium deliense]
ALSASLTNFVNRFPLSIVTRPILSAVLQGILQIHQQYFVIRKSVRELMFNGYRLNVFDTISALSAPLRLIGFRIPIPKLVNNSFALYYGRNASLDGPFEVYAGIRDATKLAQIKAWRGKTKLKYWSHDSCNAINGTYGIQFAPFVKKTDKLFVFLPEICRSAELLFQNESEVNGVTTLRFVLSDNVYKSANLHEDNWCFCTNNKTTKTCENDGVIDVSNCKSGAPLLMSNPHYLYGSPELQNSVLGLNSDVEKH